MLEHTREFSGVYMDTANGIELLRPDQPLVDLIIGAAQTEIRLRNEKIPRGGSYYIIPTAEPHGETYVQVVQLDSEGENVTKVDFRVRNDPDFECPALVPEHEIANREITRYYPHIAVDTVDIKSLRSIAEKLTGSTN